MQPGTYMCEAQTRRLGQLNKAHWTMAHREIWASPPPWSRHKGEEAPPPQQAGCFSLMLIGGREEKTSRHTHFQDPNQTPREPPSRTLLELQQQIKVLRPWGPRLGLGGAPRADSRWMLW